MAINNINSQSSQLKIGSTTSAGQKKLEKLDKSTVDSTEITGSNPTEFESNMPKLKDFIKQQLPAESTKNRGNIAKGVILAGLGATGIAAASFIPGVGVIAPGLLNAFVRLASVLAINAGANHVAGDTRISQAVRGLGLLGMGVASMAAGAGVFGPIGGLTAVALCAGGAIGGIFRSREYILDMLMK